MSFYGSTTLGSRFVDTLRSFAQQDDHPFLSALPEARLNQIAAEENVSFGQGDHDVYTPAITTLAWMFQCASAAKSCVAAVSRVIVLLVALGRPAPSARTGAYCKARFKLPLTFLQRVCRELASEVEDQAPNSWRWHSRRVVLVDGTECSLPDTATNQAAYPQSSQQQPGLGFPTMRILVFIAFATAVVLDAAEGPCQGKETGETALLRMLLGSLRAGDVVVADRYHCSYFQIALMLACGVDVAIRLHQRRSHDLRRGRRLGAGDRLQTWVRPVQPDWMDDATYAQMPATLQIRLVRVVVHQRGYRSPEIFVATTLLDSETYTSGDIGDLYHLRWHVELDLRSIKRTMRMAELVCKTPEMVRKELWMHLVTYNLVRRVMAAAAEQSGRTPRQLSFAGALQTLEAYRGELQRAEGGTELSRRLLATLLRAIGSHEVGNRPGRVEPRRVKRRQQKYPLLRQPRAAARAALLNGTANA